MPASPDASLRAADSAADSAAAAAAAAAADSAAAAAAAAAADSVAAAAAAVQNTGAPGAAPASVDPDEYRHVLGRFATGVTVITTVSDGAPAGFTCQSFGALSLDPPLVLICPSTSSSTGRRIIDAGRFCANVLADSQRDLARGFASKAADKFAGVGWSPSPAGLPLLDGAHAWVDASVETVHAAGDHLLVIGRVTALGIGAAGLPLLFYRGRFTATEPEGGAPEIVDTLLAWPRHADWM